MHPKKYDEDFKKSIVALFKNDKTKSELSKEYGVSLSAIKNVFAFTKKVKTDDGEFITSKQVKDLQKSLFLLEEENLILKAQNKNALQGQSFITSIFPYTADIRTTRHQHISWKLSDKPATYLVIDTFKKAYGSRNCSQCFMFHSHRANLYTCSAFRKFLDELNVVQSFSAKACESFFKRDISINDFEANFFSSI